jgi:hypothetical protein
VVDLDHAQVGKGRGPAQPEGVESRPEHDGLPHTRAIGGGDDLLGIAAAKRDEQAVLLEDPVPAVRVQADQGVGILPEQRLREPILQQMRRRVVPQMRRARGCDLHRRPARLSLVHRDRRYFRA